MGDPVKAKLKWSLAELIFSAWSESGVARRPKSRPTCFWHGLEAFGRKASPYVALAGEAFPMSPDPDAWETPKTLGPARM